MTELLTGALLATGLIAIDAFARPTGRPGKVFRSPAGTSLLLATGALALGVALALTGAWLASAVLVLLIASALTLISNVKRSVLGEPLVFTDFALIGAVFQHPQFYLSALRPWQTFFLIAAFACLVAVIGFFSNASLEARAIGLGLMGLGATLLGAMIRLERWDGLVAEPDPERDVLRHGLIATMLVYWRRWRRLPLTEPSRAPSIAGNDKHLVVIVQCESFADASELFGDPTLALRGLERARTIAWKSGRLRVSGFGAYTMRTEYGVLFGRGDEQLGLRQFDPFLTARNDVSWSLPNQLTKEDWATFFVHPHDLRFYGRDALMPAAGFDRLVGEGEFAPPGIGEGRYVSDEAVCDKILEIAERSERPSLIYAVTIENHGPWSAGSAEGLIGNGADYLRLLRRSDDMIDRLIDSLPKFGRPAILCFFGDHRPSIPLVSQPGGDRHTPYVIVRLNAEGRPMEGPGTNEDLTPAQLHHEILSAIRLWHG